MLSSVDDIIDKYSVVHESEGGEGEEEGEEETAVEHRKEEKAIVFKTGIFKRENLPTLALVAMAFLTVGTTFGYFVACLRKSKQFEKHTDKEFQHELLKMLMHVMMNNQKHDNATTIHHETVKHDKNVDVPDWLEHADPRKTQGPEQSVKYNEKSRYPYHDIIQLPDLKISEDWKVERDMEGKIESVWRVDSRYK